MKTDYLINNLDILIPNPKCELNYNTDYELLIAVMLSAQCTDKRVNIVTDKLFKKYSLKDLANIDLNILENEIKSLGSYKKKSIYLKEIANRLINDYNGIVPNNRNYLESLPGIGRKTVNVIFKELFNLDTIPVDTHVERVTKRLGLVKENDDVKTIENKLNKILPSGKSARVSEQILLFGRYTCKAINPLCDDCPFNCKYKKTKKN